MKIHPKVSIVIPVYNGSNFLKEAIESALAQIYKNIEILVINDGSRDNGKTAKIARSFGKKIRYFEKENGGVASALNLGIKKMTGEYFSWLSHDDVNYANKIVCQIEHLLKDQKRLRKVVLFSDFELINSRGRHLTFVKTGHPASRFIYTLFDERFIHGCTTLVPKKAFKEVGLFNEKLKNAQDYEMWFRLMKKKYIFEHVPQVLIKSRIHSQQGANLRKNIQIADEEYLYIWVLKNFTTNEIIKDEDDKMFVYLNLFLKFKKTNLPWTSRFCLWLAIRNLHFRHFRRNFGLLFDIISRQDSLEVRL